APGRDVHKNRLQCRLLESRGRIGARDLGLTVEIPQCSSLPRTDAVLSFRVEALEGLATPHPDSEQFRSVPSTWRPFCGRLSLRETDCGRRGGRKPDV